MKTEINNRARRRPWGYSCVVEARDTVLVATLCCSCCSSCPLWCVETLELSWEEDEREARSAAAGVVAVVPVTSAAAVGFFLPSPNGMIGSGVVLLY